MIGSLLLGVVAVLKAILTLVTYLILASVAMSWFSADPRNPIVAMIRAITEPMYRPIRRFTRQFGGPIDLSPFVIWLIILFLQTGVVTYLEKLAYQLQ